MPNKAIRCIETGIVYNSHKEAAKAVGTSTTCLSFYFKGIIKTTAGYHWEHVNCKHTTDAEKQNNVDIEPLNLDNELWKPISFASSYEVSSFGRVKSYMRNPKIVKASINTNKQLRVNLKINNHYKMFYV